MTQIGKILSDARLQREIYTNKSELYRPVIKVDHNSFMSAFRLEAENVMLKRFEHTAYVLDNNTQTVVNTLWSWATGQEFKTFDNGPGNHLKGILLVGKIGSGKSLLLETFTNIYGKLTYKNIKIVGSADVGDLMKQDQKNYRLRPLLIDDIGREVKEVNIYGTKHNPFQKLIEVRYMAGALTFGTSNFNFDTFKVHYGEYIVSRMRAMFNLVKLEGNDRRK